VKCIEGGVVRHLVVFSAYLPYDSEDPPPMRKLEELVRHCEREKLYLVVGCDYNAHHTAWGSTNCNGGDEALIDFLSSTNLEIFNQGSEPTFCSGGRQEVIDITLGSRGLLESVTGWGVSLKPSLSDYRHILFILFILRVSWPALLIRNPRGTNWGSFWEDLRMWLERGPQMSMGSEAGLALAVHLVQQALIFAYENNCPLRAVRTGRSSLKWLTKLESLRREVRRLFNSCRAKNNSYSWELYIYTQRSYRKEVQKASKETWRSFCGSLNDLLRSARLHRALTRDPKNRLGSLVARFGGCTQSEEETLDLLLNTPPTLQLWKGELNLLLSAVQHDWTGGLR
jgi:hypothetical protein